MECAKDRQIELVDGVLGEGLGVKCCPQCKGNWINADDYRSWQVGNAQQLLRQRQRHRVPLGAVAGDFVPSQADAKAGLCPECKRYLARAKVMVKNPFYVERCPGCGGIWCDAGEWEVLESLGLDVAIEQVFSGQWQAEARSSWAAEKEREALVEKLGWQVADRVLEMAEILESHPYGDFGVAYLMRRFDKPQ
ncbi:MAG TPA: zf-TFIIB domain-containing protein [Oscillatoriaceae cyanobacterium M33_DOE_052]|uniref:Transcription factor zinc-finger domain-containing protein n=1 Tax=Planktothricoides sp. SpSt-374 TaxID=2282167 RepID=A0A7C3ZW78_9CYAN|nr:zf-TFIIB domain-containing protein [Oscillatoriaceae cyanobacterium M33_DOE_052]